MKNQREPSKTKKQWEPMTMNRPGNIAKIVQSGLGGISLVIYDAGN